MNLTFVKDRSKRGFQQFSDKTSIHGFNELFYTKTLFWKIVWSIIVSASLVVTTYQIIGAVKNYIFQTSNTLIQPATMDQIQYPPLKFCISHWIYWLDWEKLYASNFTKETILFGMSYLTNIYSKQYFNVTKAEDQFHQQLKENNIKTMMEFYQIFARPFDNIGTMHVFKKTEFLIDWESRNPDFCYIISGEFLKNKMIEEQKDTTSWGVSKTAFVITWDPLPVREIEPAEYNSYMAEWVVLYANIYYLKETLNTDNYGTVQMDYSMVIPPHTLYADGYSARGIKLQAEIDEYLITIKAGVSRWKNTESHMCKEGKISFLSDSSCTTLCHFKASYCSYRDYYDFTYAVLMQNATIPSTLKKKNIYFLAPNNSSDIKVTDDLEDVIIQCNTSEEIAYFDQCSALCSTQGCEVWTYEVSVRMQSLYSTINSIADKQTTRATITYPLMGDVLMIIEMDSKTWEDFIGNVGGLLGIWTGASIVSIFQLVYLCCFAGITANSLLISHWFKQDSKRDVLKNATKPPVFSISGAENPNRIADQMIAS